ncbi:hypothetical protein MOQ72_27045 [Saccharopolyspora sp. K220]|uniref:hypothetical protein n=1 Tax=Saccharopolyspora soli TaxID=2926618 RepID=UPI001F55FF21|nr:hypothetical protein [Saccharopolyspora soli]MCI2421105.1 hypothetical protein [Saccharopolyspora soli]
MREQYNGALVWEEESVELRQYLLSHARAVLAALAKDAVAERNAEIRDESIVPLANQWGWGDTEVRDRVALALEAVHQSRWQGLTLLHARGLA